MKIISKITGGLGNQMFQYACGKALAHRLGAKLYLDLSWFENGNRTFMLDIFPNIQGVQKYKPSNDSAKYKKIFSKVLRSLGIRTKRCRHIAEPDYSYWAGIGNIRESVHLSGYWQNEKYFSNISSIIKQEFLFPDFQCGEATNIAQRIKHSSCSVSIHVRRGDYIEDITTNSVHGICSMEYYDKALQTIIDRYNVSPQLFLFSDDTQWIKNNFDTRGCSFVIVGIPEHKNEPYNDMHLMSLCRHHIIANSSFSWWGAWLSAGKGVAIAPKRWFAEEAMKHCNPSVSSWITI